MGAALYSYYTTRRAEGRGQLDHRRHRPGPHHRQPRGRAGRHSFQIPDEEALPIVFDLLENEGLCLGGSSGINVAGAIRLARELGPGHTIVTILCDYGTRYQSKLFNPGLPARRKAGTGERRAGFPGAAGAPRKEGPARPAGDREGE
jgi:cysteine synthase